MSDGFREKAGSIAIYLTLGSVYSFAVLWGVLAGTVLEYTLWQLFFINSVWLVVFGIALFNNRTILVAEIFTGLVFIFMLPGLKNFDPEGSGMVHDIMVVLSDLYWFARGHLAYNPEYTEILLYSLSFVICLCTAVGLYVIFSFGLLSFLGFSVFIVNWAVGFPRSDIAFLLFLLCFVVLLAKRLNIANQERANKRQRKKRRRTDVQPKSINTVFTLALIPLCAVIVAGAALMPNPGREYRPGELDALFSKPLTMVSDFFYTLFNPSYFSFQSTGFSGRAGRLGGNVRMNNRHIMKVWADERLYLAGAYFDSYTGYSWANTGSGFEPTSSPNFTDTFETMSRIFDVRRLGLSSIMMNPDSPTLAEKRRSAVIDIGNARTLSIFQTGKTIEMTFPSGVDELLQNQNLGLEVAEIMPKSSTYTLTYFPLSDIPSGSLTAALLSAGNEDSLETVYYRGLSLGTSEYFLKMEDSEQRRYLELPENLPPRVRELADQITAGHETKYEKAQAIEQYLVQFPYTLEPGAVPEDRDFVDYFLFDLKKGYCTYYASAMVVLSRAAGIPARYVEGYVLPAQKGEDGYYNVTNRNAHSWPEVYLEGFGWLTLEPTAPYNYGMSGTAPSVSSAPVFSDDISQNPGYQDYMDEIGFSETPQPSEQSAVVSEEEAAKTGLGAWLPQEMITTLKLCAAALVLFLLNSLSIACYSLYEKYDRDRISKLARDKQAEIYFKRTMKMLEYYYRYVVKDRAETLKAYSERLGRRFVFRNEELSFGDIVEIIYLKRYGGTSVSADELLVVRDGYDELWGQIRRMTPRYRLIIDRMMFRV